MMTAIPQAIAGLMRDDHIHFNRDGGDRIGRMLFDELFAERPDIRPESGG